MAAHLYTRVRRATVGVVVGLLVVIVGSLWLSDAAAQSAPPTIKLEPPSGPPGKDVTVTGFGFTPGQEECEIRFAGAPAGHCEVDFTRSGGVSGIFAVPDAKPGKYLVEVETCCLPGSKISQIARAEFEVISPPPPPTTKPPPPTTKPPPPPPPTTTTTTTTTTVTPNDPPEVREDAVTTTTGEAISIEVLANDTDPDGNLNSSSLRIIRFPANGSATVQPGGRIEYVPDPDFEGTDSLNYHVCDTARACGVGVVTVEVVRLEVLGTEICSLSPSDVVSFIAQPARGAPGSQVDLDLQVTPEAIANCPLALIQFTFGGTAMGGPVQVKPNPGAVATRQIPASATAGSHTIGAEHEGGASNPLAELSFDVIVVAPTQEGGLPPWVVPAGAGPFLLGAAAVWRRRRPYYGAVKLKGLPPEACAGLVEKVQECEEDAAAAQQDAIAAADEAQGVTETSARLRGELDACEGRGAEGAEPRSQVVGTTPPELGGDDGGGGFLLLDQDNPSAPMQDDGRLGWFYPQRDEPITGLVLHITRAAKGAGAAGMAMDVAESYAKAADPTSVHCVVDCDGMVEMLPDDYTAFHTSDNDSSTLGVEVVYGIGSPEEDEAALEHAAAWVATRTTQHSIPRKKITRQEWVDGESGILAYDDLDSAVVPTSVVFPWEHFMDLVSDAEELRLPLGVRLPVRTDSATDPCADIRRRSTNAERAAGTAEQDAATAQERAQDLAATAESQQESLWDCQCRVPASQVPQLPEDEEPERRKERWYLLEHENPHAKTRSNGKRGHYQPLRPGTVQGIVVHTAEAREATAIANYFAVVRRPKSAHVVIDEQGWVKLLPDRYVAYHAKGANENSLGLEIAYFAADWGSDPVTEEALLSLSAAWCAVKARAHQIPPRRLTRGEWRAGERGFIGHSDVDPRRGNPGPDFPWDRFLDRVARLSLQQRPA